jgi:uncharacterized LabA/DUF88 family protein
VVGLYGGASVREKEYLFIDGGCLHATVKAMNKEIFGDKDAYQPLISAVASGGYDKVFYYDAIPGRDHGENQAAYETRVQPEHERFEEIRALDRVHVTLGQIVGEKNKRQKGVDVALAVDMMSHAYRGIISKATLFAGDADFVPLVTALVNVGLHVTIWHPPQANANLKGAADSVRPFTFISDYYCFSIDGKVSAFSHGNSGGSAINPNEIGIKKIVSEEGGRLAGNWQGDKLTIWRNYDATWTFTEFHAPGSTLTNALKGFRLIHDWPLIGAEEWVQVD